MELSRRGFLKGAAVAASVGALAGAGAAYADEAATDSAEESFTYADAIAWDAEYEVVVMGMGFAGLVTSMTAADAGASVLLCDKAPYGEAGGNSRVCSQIFANAEGDAEGALTYLTALTGGHEMPEEILQTMAEGMARMPEILTEDFGFPVDELTFIDNMTSPEYPELPGAGTVNGWRVVDATDGLSLYQRTRNRLESDYIDLIDVWFESPVTSLIQDPMSKTVIGVTVERNDEVRNVRALNGVCVCCGGFENNQEMIEHYLGVANILCRGSLYSTGDGQRMCRDIGAKLWHMNVYEGNKSPMNATAYYTEEKGVLGSAFSFATDGSCICVGTEGRRWGDEADWTRHGHVDLGNGIWEMPRYPEKMFLVWDEAKMAELEEASALNENFADTISKCATIAEAAEVIGCEEENLQQTFDDFEFYLEVGRDYAFGRDVDTMTAFDGEAYYVMPVMPLMLNTQGGPQRNANAEILDLDDEVIPNLYGAGECGGFTSCMYNGGSNVAECFVFGQIAGRNAATAKGELPAYEGIEPVESNPARPGDETDLGADDAESEAAEGQLVGTGTGIGGEFAVYVTVDEDGAITSVEVGENSETEGIGSVAIEELPEQFIGLSTAEEIDAVDGVSGATVTSNAIKEAIKEALGLE